MASITLLGPEFRAPNLGAVLTALRLQGPFAGISARRREREGELDGLHAHVQAHVADLRIYGRTESVFPADRPLRFAHGGARQAEAFEEFRDRHLPHPDTVVHKLFGSEVSRDAVRRKVEAILPKHEWVELTEPFFGCIHRWRAAGGA